MRVALPGRPHLSYCTNIHPGESLDDVVRILRVHVSKVKALVCPGEPFGVGLRLSARAAEELAAPGALPAFRDLLDEIGAYVFTINGFPYGAFHGRRVKEQVYRPDWTEDDRVAYSDRLARVLAALLPDGVRGSVSTVPGAFAPRATSSASYEEIALRLARHAATLARIREETGKVVELALEPEPSCLLETVQGTCRFFLDYVFRGGSVAELSRLTGLSAAKAESTLRDHIGVCLDACHFAVEFEDPRDAVDSFARDGIRVGKVQVTDALEARFTGDMAHDEPVLAALEQFSDDVYLHQVVERRGGSLTRFLDLPDAIRAARLGARAGAAEWRIHFHVPIFHEKLGPFASTQPFLRDLFGLLATTPVTEHLEVETYTWGVLPAEHRTGTVEEAIARELEFAVALASRPARGENQA